MRTVYIRKENEEFFDKLENKSETINAILKKLQERKQPEPKYEEVDFSWYLS